MKISLTLNGAATELEIEPTAMLIDVIRSTGSTGTKPGCAVGVCGACTVMVNDVPVSSCIYFAALAEGAHVQTVEGITASDPNLVDAFVNHEGMQCGICTPGQVVSAYALRREQPNADEPAVRRFMAGNLCRCTGYATIIDSVRAYLASN